jgi:trimethylamine:corrinoid methyltransferase-like protein
MHNMIWVMEKQEAQWAKKVRFIHMCKFDLIMEMICNYQITKEATNLKGEEINLTIKNIVKVFKLPSIGIIAGRKEGYSIAITKYLKGGEEEHYTLCSCYVIYKANCPLKVMKLEALT